MKLANKESRRRKRLRTSVGQYANFRGEKKVILCVKFENTKNNPAHALHVLILSRIFSRHPLLDEYGTWSKLWGCLSPKKKRSRMTVEKMAKFKG